MANLKDVKAIAILVIICVVGYMLWDYRGAKADNDRLRANVDALSTRVTTGETKLSNLDAQFAAKLDYDNATRQETALDRAHTKQVKKHDPDAAGWLDMPIPRCLRDPLCLSAPRAGSTGEVAARPH